MSFFDCHVHSYYSPLDALNSPTELVLKSKEIGLEGFVLTDHGVMQGHRELIRAGKEHGVNIGCGIEAYFSGSDDRFDRRAKAKRQEGESIYNHIILIAKNDNGLKNLYAMQEKAFMESFYQKPQIDFELLAEYGDDIIVSSACVSGLVSKAFINNDHDKAYSWANRFKERFADDWYIELQVHNNDIFPGLNEMLLKLADDLSIKPILTTDTHFADEKDRWIEDALLILNTNPKKNPEFEYSKMESMSLMEKFNFMYPDRQMTFEKIDVFLQSYETLHQEMSRRGIDRKDIFENTLEIAEKIK